MSAASQARAETVPTPTEIESAFRMAMERRGLVSPDKLIADGKIHRCDTNDGARGKGDGSYLLYLNDLPAGGFQNWRDGLGWEDWRAELDRQPSPEEVAAAKRRTKENRREREAEEGRRHAEARERAEKIWAEAASCENHPYLTRKSIGAHGIKLSRSNLVIPLRDTTGTLQSLQFIRSDGGKSFLKGGKVAGCYFSIGRPVGTLCIVEGFATGASVHGATGYPVAIAFDAGNLRAAATALRAKFPNLQLVLCADDDAETPGNPGITKATEAARAVGGLIAAPYFGAVRPQRVKDFNDMAALSGAAAVRGAIQSATSPDAKAEANKWPTLVRLDTPDLPRLRGDVLPCWAGNFASALAAATETPPELAVAMVLAACATATARRFRVMVRPGYFESLNLWIAVALAPGNRKSAVQRDASAPLLNWEREQAEGMSDEIKKLSSEVKTLEARAKELRLKAAREKDETKSRDFGTQAANIEANMPEVPRPPRLWTSDVTPERLGTILADNDERMAWLSSEGGIFDTLAGRYSGGIPNLDLVLKSHSGDAERVDRGSRPPVFLRRPLLTVGLSPQPDVLRGLATKSGFRGRGLLGRFLYLLPPSPLGYRNLEGSPISQAVATAYEAGIQAILNMPGAVDETGEDAAHLLRLSAPALAEHTAFAKCVETTMRPAGDFENATDWAGKAPGAAARLAAVMHIVEHAHTSPVPSQIQISTMERALELMAAIAKHSLAALDLMGADERIADARKVWHWIEAGRRGLFTVRDAHQALKGAFPLVADLRNALDVLEERGYLEIENLPPRGAGRPPSPVVIVRPDIVEGWK